MSGRQWSITTTRMTVTLVSEKLPAQMMIAGAEPPMVPAYVLIQRPDGGDPIRIDADDAELLMWVLMKLHRGPHPRFMQAGADFGVP